MERDGVQNVPIENNENETDHKGDEVFGKHANMVQTGNNIEDYPVDNRERTIPMGRGTYFTKSTSAKRTTSRETAVSTSRTQNYPLAKHENETDHTSSTDAFRHDHRPLFSEVYAGHGGLSRAMHLSTCGHCDQASQA